MVGDRLDTDILFGVAGGVDTLLVTETGINTLHDAERTGIRPTFYASDVTKLLPPEAAANQ
jgi:4-nitrophenyl phosphatase